MTTHAQLNDESAFAENQLFRLACFQFQLCLTQATELPFYKGSSFHGAFGQALARIGTGFRDYFYNPSPPAHWSDSNQAPPRPYVLIPPFEDKTHFSAGDKLSFGVILYGSAIDHFLIVYAALEHLGEFMGLGKQRGRFKIETIQQLTTQGLNMLYQNHQWSGQIQSMHAQHFFIRSPVSPSRIRLNHSSFLRLKADNQLLHAAPSFALLMNRLLGRINALAAMYCGGILIKPDYKQHLLNLAETIQLEHSSLHWQGWQRHSGRTDSNMPFGGLLGETVYRGELAPFIPWLNLGQWTGIGGKTSFGLGLYEMELLHETI